MSEHTAHYVEQPRYQFFIRVAQVVLAFITMILLAVTISKSGIPSSMTADVLSEVCFVVFVCVWTWLVGAYLIATPMFAPQFYNYWAQFALEALTTLFWFCGFVSLAAWVGKFKFNSFSGLGGGGSGGVLDTGGLDLGSLDDILGSIGRRSLDFVMELEKRKSRGTNGIDLDDLSSSGTTKVKKPTFWICAAIASATSAILWVLFMVTLVTFFLALKRHRADPAKSHLPATGMPYNSEKSGQEMGNVSIAQPAPQYSGQTYPQPTPTATPVNVYPVHPTPPPQQWQQSPPPQQPYGQA